MHTVVALETLALEQKVVDRNNTVVVDCTVLGTGTAEVAVMVLVDIRRDSFFNRFSRIKPGNIFNLSHFHFRLINMAAMRKLFFIQIGNLAFRSHPGLSQIQDGGC